MRAVLRGTSVADYVSAALQGVVWLAVAGSARLLMVHATDGGSTASVPWIAAAVLVLAALGVAAKSGASANMAMAVRDWSRETSGKLASIMTRVPPVARPPVNVLVGGLAAIGSVAAAEQARKSRVNLLVSLMTTAGLGIIGSLWLAAMVVVMLGLAKWLADRAADRREIEAAERGRRESARTAHAYATTAAARDIQACCAEGSREEEFQVLTDAKLAADARMAAHDGAVLALTTALPSIGYVLTLAVAVYLVAAHVMDPAGMFAAMLLISPATGGVATISSIVTQIRSLSPSERQLGDALAVEMLKEGERELHEPRGGLVVDGLTVRYAGAAKPVLDRLSLTVHPGELVVIEGESGGGKTTLLESLGRLAPAPESGTIEIDGVRIEELRLASLRRAVVYVPQNPVLLPDKTLRENIMLACPDATPEAFDEAVRLSCLLDGADGALLSRKGPFSVGQTLRAGLARAYLIALSRPVGVLVVDEPTSAVSGAMANDVASGLLTIAAKRGLSLIVATHDQGWRTVGGRVLRLQGGSLVEVLHPTAEKEVRHAA